MQMKLGGDYNHMTHVISNFRKHSMDGFGLEAVTSGTKRPVSAIFH
jgi:hypothetical protein